MHNPEEYNLIYHLKQLKNIVPDVQKAQELKIIEEPPFNI